MHCLLNVWPIVVFLCIILSARVITRNPSLEQCVLEPDGTIWKLNTGWCVNAVLINVTKFMVRGIIHSFITFFRGFLFSEIAVIQNGPIGCIRNHGMRPPECNRSYTVIVAISDCISHNESF
uniref:Uncharacterized protein n=1 Tax=Rhizophora mucronata TaxID=61149 RepID=A0A2P2N650_RHIMU